MNLKHCPFCGNEVIIQEFDAWFHYYRIECECGLRKDYVTKTHKGSDKEKQDVIKAWNTRKDSK